MGFMKRQRKTSGQTKKVGEANDPIRRRSKPDSCHQTSHFTRDSFKNEIISCTANLLYKQALYEDFRNREREEEIGSRGA
jgi:hypothetical protein